MSATPPPVTEDAFAVDRQQMLNSFWHFLKYSVVTAVIILILMAVFLV